MKERTFADRVKCHEYPRSKNGETCEYMGYVFTSDGRVCSPRGNYIVPLSENKRTGRHITLIKKTKEIDENGKEITTRKLVRVNIARAIYLMFSGDTLARNEVVILKNPDLPPSIDNLVKMSISDMLNSGISSKKQGRRKRFEQETCEEIIERYIFGNYTYSQLAELFDCSTVTIQKIVKKEY